MEKTAIIVCFVYKLCTDIVIMETFSTSVLFY